MSAHDIVQACGGCWRGNHGQMRCPVPSHGRGHGDRHPSLSICDDPTSEDGIIVHCHAGCDWRDVKRELRRLGLVPDWKGLVNQRSATNHRRKRGQSQGTGKATTGVPATNNNTDFARQIWQQAKDARGTLVETYLRGRAITVQLPPTIRFHPTLRHRDTGLIYPTMVASVTRVFERLPCGIHRTYLKFDGTGKATDCEPKMMLGPCGGGAVWLAKLSEALIVAEGIETALSALQATGLPTCAALSTSGLEKLILPPMPHARVLIIAVDSDPSGIKAAYSAAERWCREGRDVRMAMPPAGSDLNDVLIESTR